MGFIPNAVTLLIRSDSQSYDKYDFVVYKKLILCSKEERMENLLDC